MTDEQSVIVRKKIDRVILPILAWGTCSLMAPA